MDLVDGQTLAMLVREGPLAAARAARYVALTARAIAYGHQQGILHRDLKPSNVLVDAFDQPKVTDFGLAKRLAGSTPDLTLTGQVLGTPAYSAPEQAKDTNSATQRSDIYSLGALLYHLLTGRAPFQADSLESILRQVATEEPVAPRRLNPSLSRDLENVCLKCLEKDPSQRYATAADLADDLDRFLAQEPVHARPVGPVARIWRWSRRHRLVASLVAILTLTLVSAAIGSTLVAGRIARAERATVLGLRDSLLNEATALRLGDDVLQRDAILDRIRQVQALDPGPESIIRARSEAAAALALPKVQLENEWVLPPDAAPNRLWLDQKSQTRFEVIGTNQLRTWTPNLVTNWIDTGTNRITALDDIARDGLHAALRHPTGVGIWSLSSGKRLFQGSKPLGGVTFSGAGDFAVIEEASDGLVVVDLPSGRIRSRPLVPDPIPNGDRGWFHFSVSPDGTLIVGGRVRTNVADVLRVADGRHITRLRVDEPVTASAWHPTIPMVATGTRSGRILLWRYPSPSDWTLNFILPGREGAIEALSFHPTGRLLAAASSNRRILVSDLQTRRRLFDAPGHARGFQFDAGSTRLGPILERRRFRTLAFTNSDLVSDRDLGGLRSDILGIDASSELPIAAAFAYGRGGIIHPRFGHEMTLLNTAGTRDLKIHPSGTAVFGIDHRGVSRWSLSQTSLSQYEVGERWTWLDGPQWSHLAFNRDGSRVAIANPSQGNVALYDTQLTNRLATLADHPDCDQISLSPDTTWLATASRLDRRVRVWRVSDGHAVRDIPGGDRPAGLFSPDGQWFVATGLQCTLLSVDGWRSIPLPGISADIETGSATFSPDGSLLALATDRHDIRLFSLPSARHLLTLHAEFPTRITSLAITPGNASLLAGGVEGSMRAWRLDRLRLGLRELGLDWDESSPLALTPDQPELRVRIVSQPR
jgi:WD40 repeat protein